MRAVIYTIDIFYKLFYIVFWMEVPTCQFSPLCIFLMLSILMANAQLWEPPRECKLVTQFLALPRQEGWHITCL